MSQAIEQRYYLLRSSLAISPPSDLIARWVNLYAALEKDISALDISTRWLTISSSGILPGVLDLLEKTIELDQGVRIGASEPLEVLILMFCHSNIGRGVCLRHDRH
jgi:hypothetical protein